MTETAKTGMTMNDFYLLSYNNIAKDWKERKDGWEGRFPVDHKERYMVDFETIGEISDSGSALVRMCDNYYLVATVNELRRQLVNMAFDASWLGKEEVADHSNVVRHLGVLPGIADRSSHVYHDQCTRSRRVEMILPSAFRYPGR